MSSVTFWTRLEPYTRLDDMDTGLQARVHDPLWLLARQWQTGEFGGEDAGTPVQARVRLERSPLSRFAPANGAPVPYRGEVPLEALAEREPLQVAADPRRDRRLAAEAGQMFLRMLERAGVTAATRAAFAAEAAFSLAAEAGDDDAGAAYLTVMAGRVPDGFKLYGALASGLPPKPVVAAADVPKVTAVRPAYRAWYEARYGKAAPSAWVPDRLEYAFAVAAPAEGGELVLEAAEYPGGELDWHAFDVASGRTLGTGPGDPPAEDVIRTVMPAPVRYPGIAADRWWQFEDARVNLNRIEGDPDELLRLLLVDFSLLYSNDWFVMPVEATFGAAYRFKTLIVTDAFGERTLVPHYADRAGEDWRMYALSPTDDVLFLPPVLSGSLHGEPVEDVGFVRDELANLVWAVERLAPSLAGGAFDREAARRRDAEDAVVPEVAAGELRYTLATPVPENWIPFQPVPTGDGAQIRLRRAAALLDSADGALGRTTPLGRVLEPENEAFSLHEEEIPRTGARVTRRYQYARWTDGSTALWLTRRKSAGRGESSSELRFDLTVESG